MVLPSLEAQGMMAAYRERQVRGGFLTSFFKPVRGSTGKAVINLQWDAIRYGDEMAGPVGANTGANLNSATVFSTKEIRPPEYSEMIAIHADDLMERMAGQDPYAAGNASFMARFTDRAAEGMSQVVPLIDRGIEEQAAQVLQTGVLSLTGTPTYAADFKPKSSHFPTVGTAWSNAATALPLNDLEALARVIQTDSHRTVKRAIMGHTALREFVNSDQVKEFADVLRYNLVDIDPRMADRGATRWGRVMANGFELEIWQYEEVREPVGGGTAAPYLDPGKVILLPDDPALVVGSTVIPRILPPDPRFAGLISAPMKSEAGWDLLPNIWGDAEGKTVYVSVSTRTLLLPQGIDEFGCLTT